MCDAYINPTPPSAPRRMACEMRVEPTVSHYTMKKGLKAVKITPRIIPGRSCQISGSCFKSMSTLCDAWTNWSMAILQFVQASHKVDMDLKQLPDIWQERPGIILGVIFTAFN